MIKCEDDVSWGYIKGGGHGDSESHVSDVILACAKITFPGNY